MTDWEPQDFAVQVVCEQISNDRHELMSGNGNPCVKPSIWFAGGFGPEWVVARDVRYPEVEASLAQNLDAIQPHFNKYDYFVVIL